MSTDPDIRPDESDAIGARIRAATRTVDAPPSLRARVAEERLRAGGPARRTRSRGRLLPALAGAAAAVAVAVALVVGGGAAGPTVNDAAALALARPTDPAPEVEGTIHVRAQESGIQFPNYAYTWKDMRAVGARRDRLEGRHATTVVYRGTRGTVGYTIVGGEALPWPDGARKVTAAGIDLRIQRRDGATIVTWRKNGHTCVLASRTAPTAQLVRMATWV